MKSDKNSILLSSLIIYLNGLFFDYKINDSTNTKIIKIKGYAYLFVLKSLISAAKKNARKTIMAFRSNTNKSQKKQLSLKG